MSPSTDVQTYPFPNLGKFDAEGKHLVEYEALDRLKKKEYQDLCKKYRLPHSYGNIADLRKRLVEFSQDRGSWAALVPGAVRAHLGPRQGSKTKKKSTLRWEAKDCSDPTRVLTLSVGRKGADPLSWVMRQTIVLSVAYLNPQAARVCAMSAQVQLVQTSTNFSHASVAPSSSSAALSSSPPLLNLRSLAAPARGSVPQLSATRTALERPQEPRIPSEISEAEHALVPSPVTPVSEPVRQRILCEAQQPGSCQTALPASLAAPRSTPQLLSGPSVSGGVAASAEAVTTRTVYLKKRALVFTESDVPDPPAFNDQLRGPMDNVLKNVLKWWDDARPEWEPQCALLKMNINGEKVGIPGVLWKELYSFPWKAKQWAGLKGRYSELTCLLREYDHLMAEGRIDDFWAPMMAPNKSGPPVVMHYTKAIAALRNQRHHVMQEQAGELVRDADFDQLFSYSRGGKVVCMRDATAIVKRAQKLGMLG